MKSCTLCFLRRKSEEYTNDKMDHGTILMEVKRLISSLIKKWRTAAETIGVAKHATV